MRIWMFQNVAIVILAAWPAAALATPQYKVIDLGPTDPNFFMGAVGTGIANGQEVGTGYYVNGAPEVDHAVLWNGSASSFTDLQPATGWYSTDALGTNGQWQVGYGNETNVMGRKAVLWQGSADTLVDLTPAGAAEAEATGVSGDQIVGFAYFPGVTYADAMVWNGPNHTAVDLGPGGLYGTDGVNQVGESTGGAAMWSGTSDSRVLLGQGSGYTQSNAVSVAGNQEVGYGADLQKRGRALLWYGSADSVIDLTPAGAIGAEALGTNGTEQVGEVDDGAALWMGSAESYVDLNSFLPPGLTGSTALGIDANGDIIGSAGSAGGKPGAHVVIWIPVPEPSGAAALILGLGAILGSRKRLAKPLKA